MSSPFIGEIRMFAGNFAPVGWAFCDGQILSIAHPKMIQRTVSDGVIIPSPYSRPAPKIPSPSNHRVRRLRSARSGTASAISARMPPSPWLSARSTYPRYFTETIRINDHKMSDRTPNT